MPTFPASPDWSSDREARRRVLVGDMENGVRVSRSKQTGKRIFNLVFNARSQTEVATMETFYDTNYPGVTFTFEDKSVHPSVNVDCRFADGAEIEVVAQNPRAFSYKTTIVEV